MEKKNAFLSKVNRFCGIVWLCMYPVVFGLICFTKGDLTNFNTVLEQPHATQAVYLFTKWLFNTGFHLHVITALPAMLGVIDAAKLQYERKIEKMRAEIDKSNNDT